MSSTKLKARARLLAFNPILLKQALDLMHRLRPDGHVTTEDHDNPGFPCAYYTYSFQTRNGNTVVTTLEIGLELKTKDQPVFCFDFFSFGPTNGPFKQWSPLSEKGPVVDDLSKVGPQLENWEHKVARALKLEN